MRQRQAGLNELQRRELRQAQQKKNRGLIVELNVNWLDHAAAPKNSAFEKWGLFWKNVFVVTAQKVKDPAMITFLDFQQNKKGKPNENFARELFELFMLGEGNYTEADIKEAAKAFTGYRQIDGQFRFLQNQHESRKKTVFGQTGRETT